MRIENQNSFEAALQNGVGLFLGAGFSVCAESEIPTSNGSHLKAQLPVGHALAKELLGTFSVPQFAKLPLPKLLTVLKATRKDLVNKYLTQRFSVTKFDDRYLAVLNHSVECIYTTNIDDLVAKMAAKSRGKYLQDITIRGPSLADRAAVRFFPLHGSVTHAEPDYRFTAEELITAFGEDPDRWHYLSKEIQRLPTIFWGYSLEDAGVIEALSEKITKDRGTKPRWMVLREEDEATEAYFKAQGFSVVIATTAELLDYLVALSPVVEGVTGSTVSTKVLFPDYCIPAANEVRVRPISAFLAGDEPEWYDVYTNALYRTHHFSSLLDSIHSHRHTIFVGVPGSGKSTLLKQLAAETEFGGHKLFLELPSVEQVRALATRLNGEKALVFVDDFSDDVSAMRALMDTPGIQVVGCAREFNFDVISHRLETHKANVKNVSELDDRDIQAIFDRIPDAVRSESLRKPDKDGEQTLSFFEVIEANVRGPTLNKRMNDALVDIRDKDVRLYETFVATAYVGSCGTPMTTDMLHAFLRPHRVNVGEVPTLVLSLGSLLRTYYGTYGDEAQDNFVIRSKIMSDAIVNCTPQADFRSVFEQFHEEVSPYRICRFDVFRRRAFDERHASKAFPVWEDGQTFYEAAYKKDGSPELLQQGALYLSRRKQFRLAFQWIDRARLAAPRSFSIRNSHAVILFRANIDLARTDPEVLPILQESMSLLSECYRSDKRKSYHAMVFAGQALELNELAGRDNAKPYLNEAKAWIAAEYQRQPWDRRLRNLAARIDRQI